MKFTKDQVREIYQALCAMSPDFMRVFLVAFGLLPTNV